MPLARGLSFVCAPPGTMAVYCRRIAVVGQAMIGSQGMVDHADTAQLPASRVGKLAENPQLQEQRGPAPDRDRTAPDHLRQRYRQAGRRARQQGRAGHGLGPPPLHPLARQDRPDPLGIPRVSGRIRAHRRSSSRCTELPPNFSVPAGLRGMSTGIALPPENWIALS